MVFGKGGGVVLTATPGAVHFWSADSGKETGVFRHGPNPQSSAYLVSGGFVAVNIDNASESDVAVYQLPNEPPR